MSTRTRPAACGRMAACALAALALLSVVIATPAAHAQDSSVLLTLDRQTPFATPEEPVVTLAITATNGGDTRLEDLSLGIVLGTAVRTRGDEQLSMDAAIPLTVLQGLTRPLEGSMEPGASRTFETAVDLTAFGVSQTESLIYPMSVDVRSGDEVVAELRTPILFFFQTPLRPLSFAWSIELAPPIVFGPDGAFTDDTIEREVAPGGRLADRAASLEGLADAGMAVNVVLSPVLVDTLERMADGYRVGEREVPAGQGAAAAAATLLESLRKSLVAPSVEVSVYPFAEAQVPAMLRSGLGRDLDQQIDLGRDLVESSLDLIPATAVARAPQNQLDGDATQRLAAEGATTLLVDADTVERPSQPLDFAPLPTAALDLSGGGDPMALVLPDPGAQAVLSSELARSDPVLASQQLLGALAAVWQESPVPPEGSARGVAVALTEDLGLPARFWGAFTGRVSSAPFLEPVTAGEFVTRIPPAGTTDLLAPSGAFFTPDYVTAIRQERRRVETLRSVLPGSPTLAEELERDLLYAEAGAYVGNQEAGDAWIEAVHARTESVFARASPAPDQAFILSGSTTIPLKMPGSEGAPLDVRIELQSAQLRFPDGTERDATITGEDQFVTFRVRTTGAGRIPVRVLVRAPNGRVLSESTFVVRSTAFNRIALAITAAAALALVALWLRRLIARGKTT